MTVTYPKMSLFHAYLGDFLLGVTESTRLYTKSTLKKFHKILIETRPMAMYRSNYLGLFTHFYFEACVLLFFSNNNLTNDHIQLLNVRPLSFIGCVAPMFQLSTILVQFADSLRKNAPTQVRKYKEPDAPPYSKSYPTLKHLCRRRRFKQDASSHRPRA